MSDQVYRNLANVLDTLPNGFPATNDGVEIRILKKIFAPDEAELFCDLRLAFETAENISKRTGRPLEGLGDKLDGMAKKGQLFKIAFGPTKLYKMIPWVFGIYEFQLDRLDRELVEMVEDYHEAFGKQFFMGKPQLMQVIPVKKEIEGMHLALPYERVASIVENSKSFRVADCICKKEKGIIDDPCDRPTQVCMAFAPVPGVFEKGEWSGRVIDKAEAYRLLEQAEKDALVHLTWNEQSGHYFICNCCGCCCGVLRGINELHIPAHDVVMTHYYATIDKDECSACGICAEDRCQVNAIEDKGDYYFIAKEKCIGCGLCVSTCPQDAIKIVRMDEKDCVVPPSNEMEWFNQRGANRGRNFDKYK